MIYKTITQADNWFYVVEKNEHGIGPIVMRVAAWAQNEEGDVNGLISVTKGGYDDLQGKSTNGLIQIPPLRGVYKHKDELSEEEIALSKKPG